MLIFEGPVGVGHFDLVNPRYFEHSILIFVDVVGPHVNHIRRKGEGFHHAVARLVAMGRFVAPKHHLFLVLDGVAERFDVGRIRRIVDVIGDAGAVIDAGQFPLEVPFQGIVVVDALDHLRRQVGFFVGEVDELLEVREAPGDLAHGVHVAVEFVHHEAGLADGVDVAVHRPGRDAEFLRQLVDGAAHVSGEQLHQAEEFGDFRGVHR